MPDRQRELLRISKAELRSSVQSIRKAVWYVQGKFVPPANLRKLAAAEIVGAIGHLSAAVSIFLDEHGELHNG
jgi:hypothetical protein